MSPIWIVLIAVAALMVIIFVVIPFCVRRAYRPELRAEETLFAITDDACRLPLLRYPARGPTRRRHPVILCPGLGSNRYSFDLGEDAPSLALDLTARGFEVFVVELRGPGHGDHDNSLWDFDDFVERDAPKLIEMVMAETGAPAVHWVGHSMGGMVLLAGLARGLDGVRCGVTLGSTLDFHGTDHGFDSYKKLEPVMRRAHMLLPYGWLARIVTPLSARVHNPIDDLNLNVDNCDPATVRRLDAVGYTPISPPVALQLMTAIEPGGLQSNNEGEPPFLERLTERAQVPPVLLMGGEGDVQCPVEAVRKTVRVQPAFSARSLGPSAGAEKPYGHFDMLMGERASTEVFVHITAWLEDHDGDANDPG